MSASTRETCWAGGIRRAAILAGATVVTLVLAGCGESASRAQDASSFGAQLEDGEWVTIQGEVRKVLGPHSFTLGEGERDTLVYSARAFGVKEGDVVEATGRVEAFQGAEVERG